MEFNFDMFIDDLKSICTDHLIEIDFVDKNLDNEYKILIDGMDFGFSVMTGMFNKIEHEMEYLFLISSTITHINKLSTFKLIKSIHNKNGDILCNIVGNKDFY